MLPSKTRGITTLDELQWLVIIRYIISATDKIKLEELKNVFEESIASETGGVVMSLAEQLIKEGEIKGEQRGVLKGKLENAREVILKILATRFNRISPQIKTGLEKINDTEVLDKLLIAALKVKQHTKFIELLETELLKSNSSKQESENPQVNTDLC